MLYVLVVFTLPVSGLETFVVNKSGLLTNLLGKQTVHPVLFSHLYVVLSFLEALGCFLRTSRLDWFCSATEGVPLE